MLDIIYTKKVIIKYYNKMNLGKYNFSCLEVL